MPLDCIVKAGSISNLSDARYCAGMGVDFLGFNCDPGDPGYTKPGLYMEIATWVSGVRFVAEFRTQDPAVIHSSLQQFRADLIEVSHPQLLAELRSTGLPLMLRLKKAEESDRLMQGFLERWPENLDCLVLEFPVMPPEIPSNPVRKLLACGRQILVAADFRADQVRPFLEHWSPAGLDLHGGEEIRPGERDFDALAEILEVLECN